MARMGFIQDKLEIKFLLLYIASRLIEPVPFEAMQELAMIDDGVDFFDFSECMNDLVTSGHLTLSEDGLYAITEKGLRNGQICESSLPYSVRLAADKNITVFNQKLRRRAQIRSEITPRPNGTYTVSLAFCDEQDSPLLKMELMVPKEVMAKDLADRFRKNTEQLYASVINALFEAPREKKEYGWKKEDAAVLLFSYAVLFQPEPVLVVRQLVVGESAHLPPLVPFCRAADGDRAEARCLRRLHERERTGKDHGIRLLRPQPPHGLFQHRPAANGAACLALGQKTAEVSLDPRRTQQRLRFGAVERRDGVAPPALHFQNGEHLVRARAQGTAVQQGVGQSKDRALQTHNVFVSFLSQHYILIAEQLAHCADKGGMQRRGRADELAAVDEPDTHRLLALKEIGDAAELRHFMAVHRRQAQIKRLPLLPRRSCGHIGCAAVERSRRIAHELRGLLVAHAQAA